MHPVSYESMEKFAREYKAGKVLDVGSLDINGSYRDLFDDYTGFDIQRGKNVDVTSWKDIGVELFDSVISGQTFEHVEDDGKLMRQIISVLKPNGYCCLIVPSAGPIHNEPDYRRYTVESLTKLVEAVGLEVVEIRKSVCPPWFDITLISMNSGALK